MYQKGDRVKVKNPDGPGWIAARYCEVAVDAPRRIEGPANSGAGYLSDQAAVEYEEGDRAGTIGLHPINEEIRPADFKPAPAED